MKGDGLQFRPLEGRRLLLGVGGGIAAYKVAGWVRRIQELGAEVQVVMTRRGAEFVSPLTFAALSGRPVQMDEFAQAGGHEIPHVALAGWADAVLVAPATADLLARAAVGMADDLLTTTLLAFQGPLLVAPSMNPAMLSHPATQENLERLRSRGAVVIEPDSGPMACSQEGRGRLPGWPKVRSALLASLLPRTLEGRRVVVTAGPTREPLDPVRFISNRSSGKMGYALADAAVVRGAEVVLIHGPTALPPVPGARMRAIETAEELLLAVEEEYREADVVIMAAAVADYRPAHRSPVKQRKSAVSTTIALEPTEDCLVWLADHRLPGQVIVGFCAETGDLEEKAREKLRRKGADMMIANDVSEPGAGFDWDTNRVLVLLKEGGMERLPLMNKQRLAHEIWQRIEAILPERSEA